MGKHLLLPHREESANHAFYVGKIAEGAMKKLVKQYSGQGTLIFKDNESAAVKYRIDEFQDFIPDGRGTAGL